MPPGLTIEEARRQQPQLASTFGADQARLIKTGPGAGVLTLAYQDVLAGSRHAKSFGFLSTADRGIVLGRVEGGDDLVWHPRNPWSMAVQGQTRSGKSVLAMVLLAQAAQRADVAVVGCDPTGLLLGVHAEAADRQEWIATGTEEMNRHAAALESLVREMDQRIQFLGAADQDQIAPSPACPALLLVLEEYPGLLSTARAEDAAEGRKATDRVTPRIEVAVGRLTKEGAKVGVRLCLLGQRLSARAIDTDDRANFPLRVTLRTTSREGVGFLHEDAGTWANEAAAFPPGRFLVDSPEFPGTQVGQADSVTFEEYLVAVRATKVPVGATTGMSW